MTEETLFYEISPKFTKETLKDIICKLTGEKDVTITNWNLDFASGKGDNYLSIVYRMKIFAKLTSDQKDFNANVIIKALPRNIATRKTFRSDEFFRNEISFYKYIAPAFEKYLTSKNCQDLLSIPKCLAFECDGSNDFLVLEDGKEKGFGHFTPRQETWNIEDIKLILKTLGGFHAISLGFKHENPSEFAKLAANLEETYFHEKYWNWYKTYYTSLINISRDALAKEYNRSEEERKFASTSVKDLFSKAVKCCERQNHPTSVINHGDSWSNNFLTSPNDSTDRKAILIDFQLARCGSCISDVSYFLYTSTDKQTRDQHFQDLLKYYHNQVFTSVERLIGSDVKDLFSWEIFMKEVEECFVHGLCFSLEAIPMMMLEESESFDVEDIKGDDGVDVSEVFKPKPIELKANRKRLADVIIHTMHHKYL